MTFRQLLSSASKKLSNSSIIFCETPILDAGILLSFAANISKEKLLASYPEEVPQSIIDEFERLIKKRLSGIPVSYITNKKEFFGRDFYVNPAVLIPRPDTEVIIEKALSLLDEKPLKVLDLCTGSGCIAITLKLEMPWLNVAASDISREALRVAKKNAASLGADVLFKKSNLFDNIQDSFNMIITNPPYLKTSEVNELKTLNWSEPAIALGGGEDGLIIIKRIIQKSIVFLEKEGYILIETGFDQATQVAALLEKAGFKDIEIVQDIENRNRVIGGKYYGTGS